MSEDDISEITKIGYWDASLVVHSNQEKLKSISLSPIFGQETLNEIDHLRRTGLVDEIDSILSQSRQNLSDSLVSSSEPIYFVMNAFKQTDIADIASEKLNNGNPIGDIFGDLYWDIDSSYINRIPLDLYEIMLRFHVEETRTKIGLMSKEIEYYKSEYKDKILNEIESGFIQVNKDNIVRKIDELEVLVMDALVIPIKHADGQHDVDSRILYISSSVDMADLKKLFFHEMTHGVAGKTMVELNKEGEHMNYSYSRNGLRMFRRSRDETPEFSKSDKFRDIRYYWLDEGLTELLALAFDRNYSLADIENMSSLPLGLIVTSVYREDVKIIDILRSNGFFRVNLRLFYNAYFEDYSEGQEKPKLPHLVLLHRAIDNAYQKGYLSKLDRAISSNILKQLEYKDTMNLYDFVDQYRKNPLFFI